MTTGLGPPWQASTPCLRSGPFMSGRKEHHGHPQSTRVDGSAASFTLDGELTIMGVTRPVTVQGRRTDGRVVGRVAVVQSPWGIRPYSAFWCSGKLREEVTCDFYSALTPNG